MDFYGNIKDSNNSPFVFDKIYSNRYQMEQSMAEDGIFVGRYVLISYSSIYNFNNFKQAYRLEEYNVEAENIKLYKDSNCTIPVKIASENIGEKDTVARIGEIYYVIENEAYTYYECVSYIEETKEALFSFRKNLNYLYREAFDNKATLASNEYKTLYLDKDFTIPIKSKSVDPDYGVNLGDIVYVREQSFEQSDKEKIYGYFSFYECKSFTTDENSETNSVAKFIKITSTLDLEDDDEIKNYFTNQRIDFAYYGNSTLNNYDSTVWQKVYVGTREKYIKVATLNSQTPEISLSIDAPTQTPQKPYFEKDFDNSLIKDLHIQPSWGFRIRAANKALSQDGMFLNGETGNYLTCNERIDNLINDYINNIVGKRDDSKNFINIEERYETQYQNLKDNQAFNMYGNPETTANFNTIINQTIVEIMNTLKELSLPGEAGDSTIIDEENNITAGDIYNYVKNFITDNITNYINLYSYPDTILSKEFVSDLGTVFLNYYRIDEIDPYLSTRDDDGYYEKFYKAVLKGIEPEEINFEESGSFGIVYTDGLNNYFRWNGYDYIPMNFIIPSVGTEYTSQLYTPVNSGNIVNGVLNPKNGTLLYGLNTKMNSIFNALFNMNGIIQTYNYLFNKTLADNILNTSFNMDTTIAITYNIANDTEDSYLTKNFFEDVVQDLVNLEKAYYFNQEPFNNDSTKEELKENQISEIKNDLSGKIKNLCSEKANILSDEQIQWKNNYADYYYDGLNWQEDTTTTLAGDIYYNKAGFDKQFKNKDEATIDSISISPTGYSQFLSEDKWMNVGYSDNNSDMYGAIKENPDTQELSIHLPSIGNTISDVWDIVYGEGQETLDGKIVRNTNINFDEDLNDALRLVNTTASGGLTYEPENLSSIAGSINTTHDLIGRIIIENVEGYTSVDQVPGTVVRKLDSNYIYYFSGDETYYQITDKYGFDENCFPEEEFDNIKTQLHIKTGVNNEDIVKLDKNSEFDENLVYYNKNDYKVLFYKYIDNQGDYEKKVQGYTPVRLEDPNNLKFYDGTEPGKDGYMSPYYYDYNNRMYVYDETYSDLYTYYEIKTKENPFMIGNDAYRKDINGNFINDTNENSQGYQWKKDYYHINIEGPFYLYVPNKYYYLEDSNYILDKSDSFDPEKEYYVIAQIDQSSTIEQNGQTIVLGQTITAKPVGNNNQFVNYNDSEKLIYVKNNNIINNTNIYDHILLGNYENEEDINNLDSYRRLINYNLIMNNEYESSDDFENIENEKIFYVISYNEIDDALEKYEKGKYYYQVDNSNYMYQLDVSENGDPSKTYYKIEAKNIKLKVYQPGTYYIKYNFQDKEQYIISNLDFQNEPYYEHNQYYITKDYNTYHVGQIWDYTLPWSGFILDSNQNRDLTDYAAQESIVTNQEPTEPRYRDYYYDNKGYRKVSWEEDFNVTEQNTYYTKVEFTGLTIDSPPNKLEYTVGDTLDLSGIRILANFSNNTVRDVTNTCTFSPLNGSTITANSNKINIIWNNDFIITQEIKIIDEIRINQPLIKTVYKSGEPLDLSGLSMMAIFKDGSSRIVTNECDYNPPNGTILSNQQNVQISWKGLNKSQAIAIATSIQKTPPNKIQYEVGDQLDLTGIEIKAIYNDGRNPVNITSQCSYLPADGTILGLEDNKIIITWGTLSTIQNITVIEPSEESGLEDGE